MTKETARCPEWVISACLCGDPVRYDGRAFFYPSLVEMVESGRALKICPECLGGLSIPRAPCERQNDGRVLDSGNRDRTAAFQSGAERVLALCLRHGIQKAVLKEKSPSCGVRFRYDGSFSGRLISGEGITTQLLRSHGIAVYSEEDLPDLFGYKSLTSRENSFIMKIP